MSTAAVGLEASAGIKPAGRAGIVFKRLPPGRFDQLHKDLLDLLKLQGEGDGLTVEDKTDDLGFDWLILAGADFQDAIAAIHSAATSLLEEGLRDLLLAVAFRFEREGRPEYWIYGYKQGTFYPFVPVGDHRRDNAEELLIGHVAASTLAELPHWFFLADVYWDRKGRASVDVAIGFFALLSLGVWGGPFLRELGRLFTRRALPEH